MSWTYEGNPGTGDADQLRDMVRYLIGDTDFSDQLVQDGEVSFALGQTSNNGFAAAALLARGISAKYARFINVDFDGINAEYEKISQAYERLSNRLDREAKRLGGGLGTPKAGGISKDTMQSVRDDDDRPLPSFRRRMFENPPESPEAKDFLDYHS